MKIKFNKKLGKEILIITALYAVYTFSRNLTEASEQLAYSNAKTIMKIEEYLFLDIEYNLHSFFNDKTYVFIFGNYFYGSLHFIVTIFALFYVFFKDSKRYSLVRNTIVTSTLLSLVIFTLYPLMPPRLLPNSFGFVDTLAKYPTFWSFNSKAFSEISNQFAAMPSVHIVWSLWVVFALWPSTKTITYKTILISYPLITLFVIILTSNHYVLDAVGSLIVFGFGYLLSRIITSLTTRSAIDKTASLAEIKAK
jgi:hypothetical protein